jgi:hypothetical protein
VAWSSNVFAGNGTNYVNTLGWDPGKSDYNLYFGNGVGPGVHNVIGDPRFTNADAGDFTPQPGSPVIDAGDPNTTVDTAGTTDFRGLPRIVNGRIDIGAYEAQ